MSSKFEPVIWSCDTGKWQPCFDHNMDVQYQELCYETSLHVAVNQLLEYGCNLVRLQPRCRRAYMPMAILPAMTKSMHGFPLLSYIKGYGAPLGGALGRWSSTIISLPS